MTGTNVEEALIIPNKNPNFLVHFKSHFEIEILENPKCRITMFSDVANTYEEAKQVAFDLMKKEISYLKKNAAKNVHIRKRLDDIKTKAKIIRSFGKQEDN